MHACFTNPATGTAYRLIISGEMWRITKSQIEDGIVSLTHLRGLVGSSSLDASTAGRLVEGKTGTTGSADPRMAFVQIVLLDLERTATLLTAIARDAHEVYESGCPGFRPRSTPLRQQRTRAVNRATTELQAMADAWQASGLVAQQSLPRWLAAALEDQHVASHDRATTSE